MDTLACDYCEAKYHGYQDYCLTYAISALKTVVKMYTNLMCLNIPKLVMISAN